MIELYYDTEQPLPSEMSKIYRLIRAKTKEEKNAVCVVLSEFFVLDVGVYRHAYCDDTIASYRRTIALKTKAGRASGVSRQPTAEKSPTEVNRTPVEHTLNKCSTTVEQTKGVEQTSNHKPVTSNQKPSKHKPAAVASGRSRDTSVDGLMALGVSEQVAFDYLAVRKAKRLPLTQTALDKIQKEADKGGITIAQAITISAGNGWAGFEMDWVKNKMSRESISFIQEHSDRSWADSFIEKHTNPSWRENLMNDDGSVNVFG